MKKLMTIFFLSAGISFNAFADIAVIVNPANNSTISQDDVKNIYLGKMKSFSDGSSIEPVNLEDGATKDAFDDKALNKSASQLKAYWSKLIFTGKAKPPATANNENEMIKAVSSNANAIGYIDAANVNDSVKVVATIK